MQKDNSQKSDLRGCLNEHCPYSPDYNCRCDREPKCQGCHKQTNTGRVPDKTYHAHKSNT